MAYDLNEIISHFNIDYEVKNYGNGHINDTYLCECNSKYILQRINKSIFREPKQVMDNICAVTEHLAKKIEKEGGDPKRETLRVVKTAEGEVCYESSDGEFFRMYEFITDSVTKEEATGPEDLYKAAKGFGKFQNMLADFPADSLFETIKDFHNTRKRFETFKEAVKNDKAGRASGVKKEIDFVLEREKDAGIIVDLMEAGEVPLRVTHNDTKLNNVLFDAESDDVLCVIDLDTVMPGSLLYDYGDALRFGASSGAEDERDLSRIYFDMEKFEAFTRGYLEELAPSITEKEKELLPFSVKLLTYECGMRFLTDYLNGDVYFKIHRDGHNLDRARTQLKLVYDIEKKLDDMKKVVDDI